MFGLPRTTTSATRLTHALEVAQVGHESWPRLGLTSRSRRPSRSATTAATARAATPARTRLSPYVARRLRPRGRGAPTTTLAPLNLCAETLDGIRNHSWSRPAPATPEGEVVSWADRIAYVCHDFEDAVRRRDRHPSMSCRRSSASAAGRSAAVQLGALIGGMQRAAATRRPGRA